MEKNKCNNCKNEIENQPCYINGEVVCKMCWFELKSKNQGRNCYDRRNFGRIMNSC